MLTQPTDRTEKELLAAWMACHPLTDAELAWLCQEDPAVARAKAADDEDEAEHQAFCRAHT